MSTATKLAKPKRRWYQFSLKTLLVVMTLFTVIVGWAGRRLQRAWDNQARVAAVTEAVAAIEEMGGSVVFEYKQLRSQTWLEKLLNDPGGGGNPVGELEITDVAFVACNVTDDGLKHVKRLTGLQALNILGSTNVTDAGLEHLKGLTHLEYLYLDYAQVTDIGLRHLTGLTNLKHLNLTYTKVTDAGLEQLTGLTDLQTLHLSGTYVTKEGVKKLQQALPNCEIHR